MNKPSFVKRAASRKGGASTLITAASLALTVGGWAVLTVSEAQPAPPAELRDPAPALVRRALPPMPTLVPPPDWATQDRLSNVQATAVPTTAAVGPAPRTVGASGGPPEPVAVTRSSR